jgi:hypothetical protein
MTCLLFVSIMTIMQTLYKYANNYQTGKMVLIKEGWVSFGYLVDITELLKVQIY